MSFTWFADHPLRTREQVMEDIVRAADDLDMPDKRGACVIAGMTVSREAGADRDGDDIPEWWCPSNPTNDPETDQFDHDSNSDDSESSGPFQQQPPWWGTAAQRMDPYESAKLFLASLKRYSYRATNAKEANDWAQRVQGSSFPNAYAEFWQLANDVYDNVIRAQSGQSVPEVPVAVSGDPTWLEDVLRPALGDRLRTLPGWESAGVGGTMGQIWGQVWHHTGNASATAQSIRDGRPDLAGPLAQLHIAQDGIVTIVAVGPCNHAGRGSWVGLPTDAANDRTIGVECAYPKDVNNQSEPWPDAQIISMRDVGAALTLHEGVDASHNISHYEWAQLGPEGFRQGKTDPWNVDMNWFRGEIAKDMRGEFDKPTPSTPVPPATPPPLKAFPQGYTDRELLEYIAVQLGPWQQLGQNDKGQRLTLVDAVAELRKAGA